jgi:sulfur transfer protein SufE
MTSRKKMKKSVGCYKEKAHAGRQTDMRPTKSRQADKRAHIQIQRDVTNINFAQLQKEGKKILSYNQSTQNRLAQKVNITPSRSRGRQQLLPQCHQKETKVTRSFQ